jgi:ubiquinone/menaquinone biosynthesis C-methylase UbiE
MPTNEELEAFKQHELKGWDSKAIGYGQHAAKVAKQVHGPLLDAARVHDGTELLDVACGPGDLVATASVRGAKSTGIDFAPAMIAEARKKHPSHTFREGDAEQLPFDEASFDAVVCAFGVGHLAHPDTAIQEAFRVLRAGGHYAFSWWCSADKHEFFALVQRAVKMHGNPNVTLPPAPANFRFSDPKECMRTLAATGFSMITTTECSPLYEPEDPREVLDLIYKSSVRTALVLSLQGDAARQEIEDAILKGVLDHRHEGRFRMVWAANVVAGRKPESKQI